MKNHCSKTITPLAAAIGAVAALAGAPAQAAEWSDTEILFNHGTKFREPFNPFNPDDGRIGAVNNNDVTKSYLTLQHASGYKYGRNFFFVDLLKSEKNDPQGGGSYGEVYSEGYTSLSLSKTTGANLSFGPITDISLTAGYNFGAKNNGANPRVLLFGPTVDFKVPGFIFFNVDFLAYRDRGRFSGLRGGELQIDDTTYQIAPVWLSKFSLGPTRWVFTGHVDFIGKRCFSSGFSFVPAGDKCAGRASEILAQPEIRMDVGMFFGKPETVYVGMKYNYWRSKFGYDGVNERNPQIQLDWKL